MTTNQLETRIKRHPIRGAFYGLLMGIGAAVYLVLFAITPFSVATTGVVVGIAAAVGIVWGAFAPAKKPSTMPPSGSSLKSTFTRTSAAEDTAAETYEDTFGSTPPTPPASTEPAFGHEAADGEAEK